MQVTALRNLQIGRFNAVSGWFFRYGGCRGTKRDPSRPIEAAGTTGEAGTLAWALVCHSGALPHRKCGGGVKRHLKSETFQLHKRAQVGLAVAARINRYHKRLAVKQAEVALQHVLLWS